MEVLVLDPSEPGYQGYRDYTPRFLKTYDALVGFVAPHVWRVGAEHGLDLYRRHMGSRHLDVGPGTGYFIAEANPAQEIELTLVDASPYVLDHCAKRLAAWNPTTIRANVLEPLPVDGPFDSAALAHVIHCLPGPLPEKAKAIEHIAAVLENNGVLFGGTVLGLSAEHTLAARMFLRLANLQGAFDNRADEVDGLRAILESSFEEVEIDVPTGSVAYFVAARPRRLPSA
ncbi:MAG TPA: class I SAM-dependent methyltransferase [Propionibacteriaceae bacterium]|nr:class I SAM-dependent methyltransferase [Propionibacteriaceae bacterium]